MTGLEASAKVSQQPDSSTQRNHIGNLLRATTQQLGKKINQLNEVQVLSHNTHTHTDRHTRAHAGRNDPQR